VSRVFLSVLMLANTYEIILNRPNPDSTNQEFTVRLRTSKDPPIEDSDE
jgi:hypothetical protein